VHVVHVDFRFAVVLVCCDSTDLIPLELIQIKMLDPGVEFVKIYATIAVSVDLKDELVGLAGVHADVFGELLHLELVQFPRGAGVLKRELLAQLVFRQLLLVVQFKAVYLVEFGEHLLVFVSLSKLGILQQRVLLLFFYHCLGDIIITILEIVYFFIYGFLCT